MTKIKALHVNLPMHNEFYVVGEMIFPNSTSVSTENKDRVVTEIKDAGIEYEDSYHAFYEIYADKKLFKRIEYTPVSVEYEIK